MKVLITGGAGFVGRWFTEHCLLAGYEVLVVDNLSPVGGGKHPDQWPMYSPWDYPNFTFLEMDIKDFFISAASSTDFDLVIHLAAVVGGRLSIEQDPLGVAEDLAIDALFWKWATRVKPGHIISFSSSAAYPVSLQGVAGHVVLSENDINFEGELGAPDLTYGWAKLTNEYLGRLAHSVYGLQVSTYRPFSGYGEDQDLTYPFPSICKRAVEARANNATGFEVWGSGLQGRDFIHISDVVKAVMHTYPSVVDGSALNLCTGKLTTFLELAKIACEAAGLVVEVSGDPSKPEGVFARVGDPTKLEKFGFSAQVELQEGVARGVKFQQMRLEKQGEV